MPFPGDEVQILMESEMPTGSPKDRRPEGRWREKGMNWADVRMQEQGPRPGAIWRLGSVLERRGKPGGSSQSESAYIQGPHRARDSGSG